MKKEIKAFTRHSPEYDKALDLRTRILRKPLHLIFTEEELKKDEHDIHFGLFDGEKILGCLILSNSGNGRIKMRQVAVDIDRQRTGIGSELSSAAEDYARKNGYKIIYCNARQVAVPFYKKLGYKIVGGEFIEVNIPHYTMEKEL